MELAALQEFAISHLLSHIGWSVDGVFVTGAGINTGLSLAQDRVT